MRVGKPDHRPAQTVFENWRASVIDRRRFLLGLAGGSAAVLFGIPAAAATEAKQRSDTWQVLDAVQQHLLPSEEDAPGAREINALDYLRFVVGDPKVDVEQREFILSGVVWLEDLAQKKHGKSFIDMDEAQRETLLRTIARSEAGENWLSTLLLYLMEALLTDPAYGGNPDGVGWSWLQHVPGFPRPTTATIYPELLKR